MKFEWFRIWIVCVIIGFSMGYHLRDALTEGPVEPLATLILGVVAGLFAGYDYAKWKFEDPDEE